MDNGDSYHEHEHDCTTYDYDSGYHNHNWTTANILPNDYQKSTDNKQPTSCNKWTTRERPRANAMHS